MSAGSSVSFYSKYQLERLLADGPAKTFRAVEISSGHPVYLHLFNPEGRLLFDTIAARFRDSAGRVTAPLIETGEFAGSLYAVTDAIEPFVSLSAWAESFASALPATPPSPLAMRPVAGSSTKEPGEFTRMFALQQAAPPTEAILPVAQAASTVARPVIPALLNTPAAEKEPGAFTREFMVQSPVQPVAQPVGSSEHAWPAKPAPEESSTASLLSKPETAKSLEKPMWPARPAGRSDDFSDLFGSSLPGEHVDVEAEQARAAGSVPPESKPFQRAGTFTRMFGPGTRRKEMPPEPPRTPSSLLESGLDPFNSKVTTRAEGIKDSTKGAGPGEYTRMMAVPQQAEEPQPPPAQPFQVAPPSASPRGDRAIVIAFITVGILTLAVIILAALLYSKR